jgi:hypothetical protein
MVPWWTRDSSPLAPGSRSWFVSHAQNACIDAYGRGWTYNLWHGFALRFEPSARAPENLSRLDTARACVYARHHVHKLLLSSTSPLSFVVVVPTLEHLLHKGKKDAFGALAPYKRALVEAPAHQHGYLLGLQHRRWEGGSRYWTSEFASTAYVFQNDAGARQWPVPDAFADELCNAWKVGV